jgi:hypothetical protein
MSKKYLRDTGVFYSKSRPGDSPLWEDMQKLRDIYLSVRRMQVGNGKLTSFWCDAWCGSNPLKDSFPDIFHICMNKVLQLLMLLPLVGTSPLGDTYPLI